MFIRRPLETSLLHCAISQPSSSPADISNRYYMHPTILCPPDSFPRVGSPPPPFRDMCHCWRAQWVYTPPPIFPSLSKSNFPPRVSPCRKTIPKKTKSSQSDTVPVGPRVEISFRVPFESGSVFSSQKSSTPSPFHPFRAGICQDKNNQGNSRPRSTSL